MQKPEEKILDTGLNIAKAVEQKGELDQEHASKNLGQGWYLLQERSISKAITVDHPQTGEPIASDINPIFSFFIREKTETSPMLMVTPFLSPTLGILIKPYEEDYFLIVNQDGVTFHEEKIYDEEEGEEKLTEIQISDFYEDVAIGLTQLLDILLSQSDTE